MVLAEALGLTIAVVRKPCAMRAQLFLRKRLEDRMTAIDAPALAAYAR